VGAAGGVRSAGMLDALDPAERRVLLAHERARADNHHYLFTALAQAPAFLTRS
jgi:hypothetical protein